LSFNGDLYPTAGASAVMTTSGDMVKYQSGARTRLGIGSANQLLQVKSSLPSWETVDLADTVLTTAGDVLIENSTPELARLAKGNLNDVLTMGSALPAWTAPSSGGEWTSLINEYDNTASNTFDTGYVDMGGYRVLRLFWTAYVSSGTGALGMRFYDADENLQTGAVQGTSGYFNSNTLNANGNQTSMDLTFGNAIASGRGIVFGMEIQCSDSGLNGAHTAGTYYMTQRASYDTTYCHGTFITVNGATSTDLNFCNGFQEQSGNTYTDGILTVLGSGDNTS